MVHSKEKLRNNINKVLPYFRQFWIGNIMQAFYPIIENTHRYHKIYSMFLTLQSITIAVEGMCKYHCTVSWCDSNPTVSIKTAPYIHLYAWNNSSSLQTFISFDTNKINQKSLMNTLTKTNTFLRSWSGKSHTILQTFIRDKSVSNIYCKEKWKYIMSYKLFLYVL